MGGAATRRMWCRIMRVSDNPLALARITKSSWAVFITIVLTTYVQDPADIRTKVIIGRVACHIKSTRRGNVPEGGGALYIPPGGNILTSKTESIMYEPNISRIPAHQAGRAFEVAEIREAARSILEPTRVASLTPKNTEGRSWATALLPQPSLRQSTYATDDNPRRSPLTS